MIFLDVSFGIFAFLPQGWLFMAFVIISECAIVSKFLNSKWYDRKIYFAIALTNVISGIIGIITTMILNGGWFLVVWFPWVSTHEIDINKKGAIKFMVLFYLTSFFVSLIIESITNIIFLHKSYSNNAILKATILSNLITYIVGSILLYSYSFSLL